MKRELWVLNGAAALVVFAVCTLLHAPLFAAAFVAAGCFASGVYLCMGRKRKRTVAPIPRMAETDEAASLRATVVATVDEFMAKGRLLRGSMPGKIQELCSVLQEIDTHLIDKPTDSSCFCELPATLDLIRGALQGHGAIMQRTQRTGEDQASLERYEQALNTAILALRNKLTEAASGRRRSADVDAATLKSLLDEHATAWGAKQAQPEVQELPKPRAVAN